MSVDVDPDPARRSVTSEATHGLGEHGVTVSRLDAGHALDLLCEAVRRHGRDTVGAAHGGIVAAALCAAGLDEAEVAVVRGHEIRTLWVRDRLPCPMTLGSALVFGRAQRAQLTGATWGAALELAVRAAQSLLGLVPLPPCTLTLGDRP